MKTVDTASDSKSVVSKAKNRKTGKSKNQTFFMMTMETYMEENFTQEIHETEESAKNAVYVAILNDLDRILEDSNRCKLLNHIQQRNFEKVTTIWNDEFGEYFSVEPAKIKPVLSSEVDSLLALELAE